MRRAVWSSVFAMALTAVAAAGEECRVDYRKVDRSIAQEPEYKSHEPLYGLMLFGREGKFRVWIVLDGETVYLDRNGDGDLTAEDERFATVNDCRGVELRLPESRARYAITAVEQYDDGEPPRAHLMPYVDIGGPVEYAQYGDLGMARSPREAKVAHFDGPLTAGPTTIRWEVPAGLKLKAGEKPTELLGVVGTMDKEAGCWVVVGSHNGEEYPFDEDVVPEVEIEFPRRTLEDPVLRKRYPLDGFC